MHVFCIVFLNNYIYKHSFEPFKVLCVLIGGHVLIYIYIFINDDVLHGNKNTFWLLVLVLLNEVSLCTSVEQ